MQGFLKIYFYSVIYGLAAGQTSTSEIEPKFTASKRRLNTLDPKTTEAKRGECLDKTNHKYVKKGDTFQRRGKNGLVEICTCAGQGFGRIDCVGKDGMCYDRGLDRWYREGERWETSHPENGQIMDCVCHDRGNNIGVDCTTGNRCHDQGRSYKANEQWTKMSDKGERIRCTCHGMGKGMWSCVNYPDDQVTYEEDTSIPPPSSRPLNPDSCQGNHF